MNAIKERLIGAVTVMDDEKAKQLWNIIISDFAPRWDNIPEEEPDEWDLKMLEDIQNNPDCKTFTNETDWDWGDMDE